VTLTSQHQHSTVLRPYPFKCIEPVKFLLKQFSLVHYMHAQGAFKR